MIVMAAPLMGVGREWKRTVRESRILVHAARGSASSVILATLNLHGVHNVDFDPNKFYYFTQPG